MPTLSKLKPTASSQSPKPNFYWPRFLKRLLRVVVIPLLFLYLVVGISLSFFFCTVHNRNLTNGLTPTSFDLAYSEISFPATEDKNTIRAWYIPGTNGRAIIGLHGKDGNRTALIQKMTPLAKNGYTLLLLDMRGHGKSEGAWHSLGYYEQRDVLGAIEYLKNKGFGEEQIGLEGESLGAAVGLLVMSQTKIKAMVADSPFARLSDILETFANKNKVSAFLPPMLVTASLTRGIDINQVVPENAVKNIKAGAVLLIHGEADGLIPISQHYRLKAALGAKAASWVLPNADHLQAYQMQPEDYESRILAFFQKNL